MDELFVASLAVALKKEFKFMSADDEGWKKAAQGVAEKMGFDRVVGTAAVDGGMVQNVRFQYPKEGS